MQANYIKVVTRGPGHLACQKVYIGDFLPGNYRDFSIHFFMKKLMKMTILPVTWTFFLML